MTKTTQRQPWKSDDRLHWEYGDLRLRALHYVYRAGGNMQAISLRGHLLLDVAITQLLLTEGSVADLNRVPFRRKLKMVESHGLFSPDIKSILSEIARIRNAHAHDLETHYSFRQIHALWARAETAGIEHRFFSSEEEAEAARVTDNGELADQLFEPARSLADLCVELFAHIVFWDYDSFDIAKLKRILNGAG